MTDQLPAPGWYEDPEQVQTQRYWTGTAWTEQRAPLPAKKQSDVWVGVVLALLIPFIGFIFGIVMLFRGFASGLVVMLLSVLASGFWLFVLAALSGA